MATAKSVVSILRYLSLVIGGVVMGLGVYSHFQSDWTKLEVHNLVDGSTGKLHKVACELAKAQDIPCPPLAYEQFFVAVIVIAFTFSLIGLIASFVVDLTTRPYQIIDFVHHAVACLLLAAGGFFHLLSTVQIETLLLEIDVGEVDVQDLGGPKVAAGMLAALQAILCLIVAALLDQKLWKLCVGCRF